MINITNLHARLAKCEFRSDTTVIHVCAFDEEAVTKFNTSLNAAISSGQTLVPVVIDSYGGHVHSLMAMADMIRSCPVPVATVAEGKAMSCGAFLLSFGTPGYRFMGQNASVMIHEVTNGKWGKVEEIVAAADETRRLNALAFQLLDSNCGQELGYFQRIIHERSHADWYLTPEEVLSHGLVDHIRIPQLVTTVSVRTELL